MIVDSSVLSREGIAFDLLILGGGAAGLSLAQAAGAKGLYVLLVEAMRSLENWQPPASIRLSIFIGRAPLEAPAAYGEVDASPSIQSISRSVTGYQIPDGRSSTMNSLPTIRRRRGRRRPVRVHLTHRWC
jgi:choline dehydrogenase-like flavoprotein